MKIINFALLSVAFASQGFASAPAQKFWFNQAKNCMIGEDCLPFEGNTGRRVSEMKELSYSDLSQIPGGVDLSSIKKVDITLNDDFDLLHFDENLKKLPLSTAIHLNIISQGKFNEFAQRNFEFVKKYNEFAENARRTYDLNNIENGEENPLWRLNLKITLSSDIQSIPDGALYKCCMRDELILPESVQQIGEYAFADSNIERFTGNGVQTIGAHAFENSDIWKVTLDKIKKISPYAFANASIKYFSGENVETIEQSAFERTERLQCVDCPNLKKIGDKAFFENHGDIYRIWVPLQKVTEIGSQALFRSDGEQYSSNLNFVPGICFI